MSEKKSNSKKKRKNTSSEKESRFSEEKLKLFFKNSLWTIKKIYQMAPRDTIFSFIIITTLAIIPIITSYLSAQFIDELVKIASPNITGYAQINITHPIFKILILYIVLNLAQKLINQANHLIKNRFDRLHLRKLRLDLYRKISLLNIKQFEDKDISNSIRKAKDNVYKMQYFWTVAIDFFSSIISIITTISILLPFSPLITLVIIILSIPNNYFFAKSISELWKIYNKNTEINRKSWWIASSMMGEEFQPEHKINNTANLLNKKLRNIYNKIGNTEMHVVKKRFWTANLGHLINLSTYIIVPLHLINKYLKNTISIGNFSFYFGQYFSLSTQADFLLGKFFKLFDLALYIEHVREILKLKPAIKNGPKKLEVKEPPKIEFQNVSFKYPKSKKYVLKNINLTIEPKEEIALVGKNGAGKTTLIKLLLRFYEPQKGQILINHTPIEEFDLKSYYRTITAIFQDFNFYGAFSVKENIGISEPRKQNNLAKIKKAAKKVEANKFIESLSHKYDQILSKSFTNGTNLSKGQKQKIALARIFYRTSKILILDEPTASIDAEAEHEIFNRIYDYTKTKTVIIISHRFSTVKHADRIYVLENGKIVERGNHQELLDQNGKYAESFKLQAKNYETETAK
jgi:ABC-type multidrug transport system fused ATPase/permease subunit